jgi:GTPase involved in cell partitioning and DNA repair
VSEKIASLEDGQEVVLLNGGRGGLGNFHFFVLLSIKLPEYAQR